MFALLKPTRNRNAAGTTMNQPNTTPIRKRIGIIHSIGRIVFSDSSENAGMM